MWRVKFLTNISEKNNIEKVSFYKQLNTATVEFRVPYLCQWEERNGLGIPRKVPCRMQCVWQLRNKSRHYRQYSISFVVRSIHALDSSLRYFCMLMHGSEGTCFLAIGCYLIICCSRAGNSESYQHLKGMKQLGRWEKLYIAMFDGSYCPPDINMVFRSTG
jgi:hypothetical protein